MTAQTAAVPLTPDRAAALRALGLGGATAGLLFAAMSIWQHTVFLESGSTASAVNQAGFAVAMIGYVGLAAGVSLAAPGGTRGGARTFPLLIAVAWTVLLAADAIEALTPIGEDNALLPVGGLAQVIGLTGLGITTAVAGRWSGWRRYWPLALAVYFVSVLFVPAVAGAEPNAVTETVWALGYAGLGVALWAEESQHPHRGVAAVVAGTGAVVATVAVVLSTVAGTSSVERTVPATPVVEDGRWGGPDVFEHRPASAALYGSADSLERRGSDRAGRAGRPMGWPRRPRAPGTDLRQRRRPGAPPVLRDAASGGGAGSVAARACAAPAAQVRAKARTVTSSSPGGASAVRTSSSSARRPPAAAAAAVRSRSSPSAGPRGAARPARRCRAAAGRRRRARRAPRRTSRRRAGRAPGRGPRREPGAAVCRRSSTGRCPALATATARRWPGRARR